MNIVESVSSATIDGTVQSAPALRLGVANTYQRRSLSNLFKMGHCAPTVMQTILDVADVKKEWLVKLTAGLPGGIGNAGFECGGVTAPLVLVGLRHGLSAMHDGLPRVFYAGHHYCQQFLNCNNSLFCRDIRGTRRLPTPCIGVIRHSPELYARTDCSDDINAISGEKRNAFRRLYGHLTEEGFHCSHAMLRRLRQAIPVTPELLDGTAAFVGGTLFKGLTCSALTAGIMAVGLKAGEIEDSRIRVIRTIATMVAGGNAFADHLNRFNRIMNIGNEMSEWFTQEFGSTCAVPSRSVISLRPVA
jgi:hypothetical protein